MPELPKLAPPAPKRVYPPAPYTVRLYFGEPENRAPGQRVFDVALQGRTVLEKFDINVAAGGSGRGVVKEINGVIIQKELKISFTRAAGSQAGPLLCGVELIAERRTAAK